MTRIVIDAMGGDFAPKQQVLGAVNALNNDKDLYLILVGDETQIKAELSACKYDETRLEIVHTTETIGMEEVPTKAVKTKKDSSLVVAFRLLKEGKADGLVSSGSTGAVLTAGVLVLGRLKGVSRPALCPAIPNYTGGSTFLCDCGANLECKPINLLHFAVMATAYAQTRGNVLFDCKELNFIDSTTLGTFVKILKMAKTDGYSVRLTNLQPKIKKLFVICSLDSIMELE